MKRILVLLLAAAALAACRPAAAPPTATPDLSPSDDEPLAIEALFDFFGALEAGDYGEAAAYYGGSYEVLQGYNPAVDPADTATLFRNACSVNGFSCLTVREVTLADQPAPGEYVFDVSFSTREGDLFVLGPCCGATEEEQPPVAVFPIRVARGEDGRYRVLDLPPYRP